MITAVGEIDIATAPLLADALRDAPSSVPTILDLAAVTFMDCAGLHPILAAHEQAAAQSIPFILVPAPAISRVLQLTSLQHILHTRPTVPAAISATSAT